MMVAELSNVPLYSAYVWRDNSGVIQAYEDIKCRIDVSYLHLGQNMSLNLAMRQFELEKP